MRNISVEYYPDLKNVSGYIGTDMVISIQYKEFTGWIVVWQLLSHKNKSALREVKKKTFAKFRKIENDPID